MARNGKIARLPLRVRRELNQRLDDGEQGKDLVVWLNGLAEVDEILKRDFGGRAVTEQNMSEWRQGGYLEWRRQQEAADLARCLSEQAEAISDESGEVPLSDQLSGMLALALGKMIRSACVAKLETAEERREVLAMAEALSLLRRSDHTAERLQMLIDDRQEESERNLRREMEAEFRRREMEPLHDLLRAMSRENLIRSITKGMTPEAESELREMIDMPRRGSSSRKGHRSAGSEADPSQSGPIQPDQSHEQPSLGVC